MSTPVHELDTLGLPEQTRAGEGDTPVSEHGTFVNEVSRDHLTVDTQYEPDPDRPPARSPSQAREQAMRLEDDLTLLQAERVASRSTHDENDNKNKTGSVSRSRSRRIEQIDDFDEATNPLHEKAAIYTPPEHPHTSVSKIVKKIHNSSFIVRYFTYIVPVVALLLIPLLLGALVFPDANVGGVRLLWFSVWLEIVWLTLWAGRIVAKTIPPVVRLLASIFTNNARKWRDLALQLELHATLFFWWLGVEVSFLPTMVSHHVDGNTAVRNWESVVNKIITSIFVWMVLNLIEKFIIQLIAISFHTRTYADRIEINKFQIGSLTKLYAYSKEKIAMEDEEFEEKNDASGSGTKTPLQYANRAQKAAKGALNKVGDVAGAVAADFLGRKAQNKSTHPYQVVLTLLQTSTGSQVLARRLYRTFVRDGFETVFSGDLKEAFDNNDEAEAAFTMFDRDMNGDISMEELEAACVEIGRERKAITASLKDLDSVVSKLDDVLSFVVFVIAVIVLLSIISTSTAGVLTSFGSSILALSWLFSATAQEFLQSVIFVFVKHPFDVGDRVTIYGNTGDLLRGDDYFVKQISLLYTEFKKMQGHVVQAPNSYLNTLFILNQRRSGALAEAVPVKIKYGTTIEQMEALRQRLLEFVRSEKREFQTNILTELREVFENYSLTLNVVFFYKSNWQNEGLRLQRRNKFICMLMTALQEIGIEGPRMNLQGAGVDIPFHVSYHGVPTATNNATNAPAPLGDNGRTPVSPLRSPAGAISDQQNAYNSTTGPNNIRSHPSILRKGMNTAAARARGDSLSHKHVDFSLGMRDIASSDLMGDVFEDNSPSSRGIDPIVVRTANREAAARRIQEEKEEEEEEKEEEAEERAAQKRRRNSRRGSSSRLTTTSSSSMRFRRVPTTAPGEEDDDDERGSVSAAGAGAGTRGQRSPSLSAGAGADVSLSQDQARPSTDSHRSFASSIHNSRFFRSHLPHHHHHRDNVDAEDLMEQGRVSENRP